MVLTDLSESRLEAWGRAIGASASTPLVLALRGELGAGKSVLARAIARGAGVVAAMPSPTYNLVFRYDVDDRTVMHVDLYRLEDPAEVWELGWQELGDGDQIALIEWPERAEALLPEPRWEIELTVGAEPTLRDVRARPIGAPPPLPGAPAELMP